MPDDRVKLDAYDLRILEALQRDGRMKKVDLARAIGLSPSPCWERLRRLEKGGFILGYRAEVDVQRVVKVEHVLVTVTLHSHEAADFERFEAAMIDVPEVVECYAVGGGVDYLLHFVVPDIGRYQALIEHLLADEIGIRQYFTYVVTKRVKRAAGFPIAHLLGRTRDASKAPSPDYS